MKRASNLPDLKLNLDPELSNNRHFLHWERFEINSDGEAELASSGLIEIKKRLKELESFHKQVVGPIKQGIRAFEERLRLVKNPLELLENTLKRRLAGWWDAQQAKKLQEAELKRSAAISEARAISSEQAELAMETGSQIAAEAALNFAKRAERLEAKEVDASQTIRSSTGTVVQSLVWAWRLTDLSKVPREFLVLDEKALNALCRAYDKNPCQVPGIEFVQESRVSVTR